MPITLLFMLGTAGTLWFVFGPHRGSPTRLIAAAARHGLLLESGKKEEGWFSSSWRSAKLSLRDAPGVTVEMGMLRFDHWPFVSPQVTVSQAHVRLRGEPVPLLAAITRALRVELAEVAVTDLAVIYEHRVLGRIAFDGVTVEAAGPSLLVEAERAHAGGLDWPDVRLFIEPRKDMFVIGWGGEVASARLQLSCFPPAGGAARWLLNVLHQPVRPLLGRFGWDLGEAFAGAQVAGGISLDVPDDPAEPPRGRVQFVFDGWPLGAPAGSKAVLGRSFSLLSNLVPAAYGSRWELPRVAITMPVFSLVGQGHVDLDRRPALALTAQGERVCRELGALLPPSPERDQVQRFLAAQPNRSRTSAVKPPLPARLAVQVRAGAGAGYRPEWTYRPACGLAPWAE
ncbi:MAG: hypothetical protein JXP73_08210 [Deltaproteobacteria bacterium]|nr:hypothetical protein [Deltaproteobacteria bacterium]